MTTPTLPTLVFAGKTKVDAEVLVYYNLGLSTIVSYSVYANGAAVTVNEIDCSTGASVTCPSGNITAGVVFGSNVGSFGAWGVNPPLYAADVSAVTATGEGDIIATVCLPDPANDVLICYDQGIEASPGLSFKPIPRKFQSADHYVRQRAENTLTLNDLLVCSTKGLQRVSGRLCTIIVKIVPNGAGVPCEIQYYGGVLFSPKPMNSGQDGNASVSISMQSVFNFCAIFSSAYVPPS